MLTSVCFIHAEPKPTAPAEAESNSEDDDITFLKSLAEKSKESNNETPISDSVDEKYGTDEADTTKNRRLADDYDSTKNGMDYKYQGKNYNYHVAKALFGRAYHVVCVLCKVCCLHIHCTQCNVFAVSSLTKLTRCDFLHLYFIYASVFYLSILI